MKIALAALAAVLCAGAANAQVFTESTDGFGIAGGATPVTGVGPLTQINGSLTYAPAVTDAMDFWVIDITNPAAFSATTVGSAGMSDTVLYLFNVSGTGIAKNDDTSGSNFLSTLPVGNALYSGLTPGQYVIGISSYGIGPARVANPTLFADLVFPVSPFTGVQGPQGANDVMTGTYGTFDASGFNGGNYSITLTGAAFVPTPASAGLLVLGGLVAARRRRA
jgi:hypothetical protein